jgi:hypothetical protein
MSALRADDLPGHGRSDAQAGRARHVRPVGHERGDTQACVADGDPLQDGDEGKAGPDPTPIGVAPDPYAVLRLFAECYEDAQRHRIALGNRLHAMGAAAEALTPAYDHAVAAEKVLALGMRKAMRRAVLPTVLAWIKDTPGLGEHLMARLLGCIGDPATAYPKHWEGEGASRHLVDDEPHARTVSQLWSYCGVGDPARKKAKGMTADDAMALGNPNAKMIVRLIAEACMKCAGSAAQVATPEVNAPACTDPTDDAEEVAPPAGPTRRRSPYRNTYDEARAHYLGRAEWTPAHQHAAALRKTGKAVLRDLWRVANDLAPKESA